MMLTRNTSEKALVQIQPEPTHNEVTASRATSNDHQRLSTPPLACERPKIGRRTGWVRRPSLGRKRPDENRGTLVTRLGHLFHAFYGPAGAGLRLRIFSFANSQIWNAVALWVALQRLEKRDPFQCRMAPAGSAKMPLSGPLTWLTEPTQDMGDNRVPNGSSRGCEVSPMSLASQSINVYPRTQIKRKAQV
jgi:hypothetical protein